MPHAPVSPVATLLSPSGFRAVPVLLVAGFALLIAMVATSLFLSVRLSQNVIETGQISDYRKTITDVFNQARDSEIGQRGYLLTGNTEFLKPYESASKALAPTLAEMVSIDGERGKRVAAELEPLARAKMAELATTIALYKAGKSDEVLAIVRGGQGKRLMDAMRAIFERERRIALDRSKALERASRTTVWWLTLVLVGGMVALLVIAVLWFRQARSQFAVIDLSRAEAEGALEALKTEAAAREASEAQLRQLQKMEAIGQLTGGIAHDFNNMLAVVMGSLELAQRRLPEGAERVSKLLDNAREGATRAAALTARLLAFSRQQPLAPKPIETGKLIDGMCDMLTRTLGDAISVECVNSAGLWRCYADASEVENAILNLAVNARDAMPDGGKLTIESANANIDDNYARTHSEVEPGQYVAVCVTDTGVGMPPDVIARAFDPFFTTKAVGKGTGLGLSQVFGFAKQSGGHVAIYSEVGQGTTIKLYLPRFLGSGDADPPLADHATPEGKPGEIILVVEDEQRVRHFAVDVLRELGYTALSADGPAEALTILGQQPEITMLFTDIVMPDMNGRKLADLARAARPDLKILFTTGYTRNAVVHNGMLDIGVAFLPKPYNIGELARKIREVLDGRGVNRTI
jgi:signal transduction histidine kinase/CheY-like chemotaxis protein